MDREEQIEILLDHFQHPRHRHDMPDADVTMPGGNPGCGDVITIYLKAGQHGEPIADISWVGEGCTISQAAASILMEMVIDEGWTLEDALSHDYSTMIEILGKEAVQSRPKCATLALGTLKAAVHKYQRDQMRREAELGAELGTEESEGENHGIVIAAEARGNSESGDAHPDG